jgi:hypothetical protein
MSFEKGGMTFRVLKPQVARASETEQYLLDLSYLETPGVGDYTTVDVCRGVTLHTGEKPEGEDFLKYGENVYFAMRTRERVIDKKAVKELVNYLLDKFYTEKGYVAKGKNVKEIKENAEAILADKTFEDCSGIRAVLTRPKANLLVEGASIKKVDSLLDGMGLDTATNYTVLSPDELFTSITGKSPAEYLPYSINGKSTTAEIGKDFLTWLWMASETDGKLPGKIVTALCGDIVMKGEGRSSLTTKLSKGTPWAGEEVCAAFNEHKKVSSAKFRVITKDDYIVECMIDEEFVFSGFKTITEIDGKDPQEIMDERIRMVESFLETIEALFERFLQEVDPEQVVTAWVHRKQAAQIQVQIDSGMADARPDAPLADGSFHMDVEPCPKCGKSHDALIFTSLTAPFQDYSHWGMCPDSHDPIMMKKREDDS